MTALPLPARGFRTGGRAVTGAMRRRSGYRFRNHYERAALRSRFARKRAFTIFVMRV